MKIDYQNYINQKKEISEALLLYIDDLDECVEFETLQNIFIMQKINEDKHELSLFLRFILKIANNHRRSPDFFDKIKKIILFFKNDFKNLGFSNEEIFAISQSNKLISLILIEEKILEITNSIKDRIMMNRYRDSYYPIYFHREINDFLNENEKNEIKNEISKLDLNLDYFDSNRKIGENHTYICELIRNDSVEDFIILVNKKNWSLSSRIEPSVFETNRFLIKNKPNLIEYAAFYGSPQIFKYIYLNRNDLLKPSVWNYVIHGRNPEMIHFLEENQIQTIDKHFNGILNESIKCHHNEITNYIMDNFLYNDNHKDETYFASTLKSYNYSYFPDDVDNSFIYFHLCKNDYYNIVQSLKNSNNVRTDFQSNCKNNLISTINIALIKENYDIVKSLWDQEKKQINSSEFENCSCLNSLIIPDSVAQICEKSFFSSSIKMIKIPESVITIGKSAFENCSQLMKIEIPSNVVVISNNCFKNCKSIQKVEMSSSIKSIGKNAFEGCSSLVEVLFKEKESSTIYEDYNDYQFIIDDFAFKDCVSLKRFVIPKNLRIIGKNCFSGCISLEEVVFHDRVSTIGWNAFWNCESLRSLKNFGVTSIGHSSFEGCSSLREIKIPDKVKSINCKTFMNCWNLKKVDIPSSVVFIGESAFCNCKSLQKIKILGNISTIKKSTFQGCSSLADISIPSTIKSIDKYAFQGCKTLKNVFVPNDIKSVGWKAFDSDTMLYKYVNY